MPLFVKKLDPRATLPTINNPREDLAYDLYALEDTTVGFFVTTVRTGVALQHTDGYEVKDGLLVRDRSSMALKGLLVSGGVIDAGYTGEVVVLMSHTSYPAYNIKAGDKIAQVIPITVLTDFVVEVDEMRGTRGDKGFGSSSR